MIGFLVALPSGVARLKQFNSLAQVLGSSPFIEGQSNSSDQPKLLAAPDKSTVSAHRRHRCWERILQDLGRRNRRSSGRVAHPRAHRRKNGSRGLQGLQSATSASAEVRERPD